MFLKLLILSIVMVCVNRTGLITCSSSVPTMSAYKQEADDAEEEGAKESKIEEVN